MSQRQGVAILEVNQERTIEQAKSRWGMLQLLCRVIGKRRHSMEKEHTRSVATLGSSFQKPEILSHNPQSDVPLLILPWGFYLAITRLGAQEGRSMFDPANIRRRIPRLEDLIVALQ